MIIGAAIGAVGAIVNRGLGIYESHQQSKIDEKKRSDEMEIAKLNSDRDIQVASYGHDTGAGTGSLWVVNILRLVRPSITFYALALVTLFWFFAAEQDKVIIIASVLDICTMSIAWWFGSRR